jgi:hypothetical protein
MANYHNEQRKMTPYVLLMGGTAHQRLWRNLVDVQNDNSPWLIVAPVSGY